MEENPRYNLLQAIDPTKIKVPISDRFAKLTLSSNKKQQQKCLVADDQVELKRQQEKRKNVSRNISKQFDNDDQNQQQNPLLRSDSSKDTECNDSVSVANNVTMERLHVTEDCDNTTQHEDDDIDLLSQQVASMIVSSKALSLSSSSTGNRSLLTELFSSDSKHSSSNDINNIHVVHNIPINVEEASKRDTMYLNLTPTYVDDNDKTYEMTDDDEDEYENEAITISDTSENNSEQEPNVMTTSSLPSSCEILKLPSLMDDKAERVAAFLKDVSEQQRVFAGQGQVLANDTVDQILDNREQNLTKSQQIAIADTESMTADADEEVTSKSLLERKKPLIKTDIKKEKSMDSKEQEDDEETSRIVSRTRTPVKASKPKTPKNCRKDLYRLADDETQCNTEYSMAEESPENHYKKSLDRSRQMIDLKAEKNTQLPLEGICASPNENIQFAVRRIASEDTVVNSISDSDLTQLSEVRNISKDYKTPVKCNDKALARNEKRNDSSISDHSIPPTPENEHQSYDSNVNSSSECNGTVPDHSITILETDDDENIESKSPGKSEVSADNKLSNSFQEQDTSDDSDYEHHISQIKMPMGNINISAKINIKIHIPITSSTSDSEDDEIYKRDSRDRDRKKKETNSLKSNKKESTVNNGTSMESKEQCTELHNIEKLANKSPGENVTALRNKSPDSEEIVEDEKFVTDAEKLLTQLYGSTWKTPDIIRTLKRSSQSADKKSTNNNSKCDSGKQGNIQNSIEKESNNKTRGDESILDDFSIFRRAIVKTDLDSTRLGNQKSIMTNKGHVKLRPETEVKPLDPMPVAKVGIKTRRINRKNYALLVDDRISEDDNASDDDDADVSWSKKSSEFELEDSDIENSPRSKPRNRSNTTKRQGGSDKSDYLLKILNKSKADEIVYLDLSKDEVEVQANAPKSPPANHDVTFASRLQDILKTCRPQDKAKLPTSNKKTRRKLFTPNFDNDEVVADVLPEEQNIAGKKDYKNTDNEILDDKGICPFDSRGRPKVLVNKYLESVKTGKPVFQLTPPTKKKGSHNKPSNESTPKTQADEKAIFKTPLTVKSKCPAKSFKQLYQTPDYKYSFLKSLDVAVSKSFCHPDALYYRENYRTKKEDLSQILYDMYNDRLFDNKLDVNVTWNKKLLNTAGRCLNKKKLGIRSSVVELSDKVLTSADRLRCTLIHELCHAATWIFSGEGGHGSTWKEWARKANLTFPEIPKIGVCHQYDIEYKYTYKCTLCGAKSHAHSKSKKVENIRCSYCHGAIEVLLNKKDKDGNVIPTPVKQPTGFAKFVKDNYKKYKRDDIKHADVMKLLSNAFASLKVVANI